MNLSSETISVLKNFSTINPNMKFRSGTDQSTVSPTKSVLARTTIKDDIPEEFHIADLNEFLAALSSFKDVPSVEFGKENRITLKSGKHSIKYTLAAGNQIISPTKHALDLPSVDAEFDLSAEDLSWWQKTAATFGLPNLAIVSDGDNLSLVSLDIKDNSKHSPKIEIGAGNGNEFQIVFKLENIKLIPGDYSVQVCFAGFTHFKHKTVDLEYWVAIEEESKTGN